MIVAIIGLEKFKHTPITIDQTLILKKSYDNDLHNFEINAFNEKNQQVGILSPKCYFRTRIFEYLKGNIIVAKIWAIYKFQVCVEIDLN